jgi:hypothetical protein
MATKTWKSVIPSEWLTAASWDPIGPPATGDDVIFNSTYSGNCSITTTSNCRSIVMTGYSGIISGSGQITISGSNTGTLDGNGNTLVLSEIGNASNFIYSGPLVFTAVNGTGRIYCNGKSFSSQLNFNSVSGNWNFMDTFYNTATVLLSAGTLYFRYDAYIGIVSTSNTATRTFSIDGSLYLTGSGTLIVATVTTNLVWNVNSIYIWSNQSSARTLTFNTIVYTKYCELGGTGSGSITLVASTTGVPRVRVTNTGGSVVSFSSATLSELIFSGGTNVVWSNQAAQTLSILGDITLTSTMGTPTLTPSFIFRSTGFALANNSRITLAGKSLVTGLVTLNDTLGPGAGLGTFTFVDAFTSNNGVVLTSGVVNINANFNITTNVSLTFTSGTLNVNNGANITTGLFSASVGNTRFINMGSGNWTLTGSGTPWNINGTGMTLNAGTSRIVFTDSTANGVIFSGGGLTYYTVECNRGGSTGNFTFASINTTITNFIDVTSTAAHSVLFSSSGTFSFHRFIVKGNPGSLITVGRTGAVTGIVVSKLGRGIVSCNYLALGVGSGFSATPSNTWYAGSNSTGSANGWVITNPPSSRPLLGSGGVG